MTILTVLDFGSQGIRFEERDGRIWVCLTDMAKATDKRVNNWNQLNSTQEYLTELESITGIPVISTQVGGDVSNTGTWALDEVAVDFAAWCNTKFRIWMNQQIKILMTTGKVELLPQPIALPPSDIRITNLVSSLQALSFDLTNPRFNQELKDIAGDILGLTKPTLPAVESTEVWLGVAERAEQLGYPVALVVSKRIGLGKFVKKYGLEPKKEKRLCNGTQREINLYLLCEELDDTIRIYFSGLQ